MSDRFRHRLGVVVLHIVVVTGALLTMLPIAWMVYASFKTTTEIFKFPPWLPPAVWSFENYRRLLVEWPYPYWYINSIVYAAVVTVFVLLFCSLAGFAFAKYTFRAKNLLFIILIGSTMIPFQLILIPLFILMSRIDWINHPYSMIVPWVAPAFGIFLMRQYVQAVPSELMESARIDGASELRIYAQIVIPLVRPGLNYAGYPDLSWLLEQFYLAAYSAARQRSYHASSGYCQHGFGSHWQRRTLWRDDGGSDDGVSADHPLVHHAAAPLHIGIDDWRCQGVASGYSSWLGEDAASLKTARFVAVFGLTALMKSLYNKPSMKSAELSHNR